MRFAIGIGSVYRAVPRRLLLCGFGVRQIKPRGAGAAAHEERTMGLLRRSVVRFETSPCLPYASPGAKAGVFAYPHAGF